LELGRNGASVLVNDPNQTPRKQGGSQMAKVTQFCKITVQPGITL
jgi:hypothetical protein